MSREHGSRDLPLALRPGSSGTRASSVPPSLLRRECPRCGERYPADFLVCPRDATQLVEAQDEANDPLLGTILDETYEVRRVIGEGAMGRVYEARHTRLFSKRYAIKILHGELTRNPEVVGRFWREAEATSALRHPNIVEVLDVNRVPDGRPYIVAELLEGEQLGDYVARRGGLPFEEAVALIRPICQALIAAHDKNIVHRDIKPENVILVGKGTRRRVKVLDFGISRVGDAAGNLTKTGMVMGTPAYMPPEQARGMRVDHRADIYSVGALLYEAVTGKQAFDDSDPVGTLAAVVTRDPPRPCSLVPTLPPGLELVIQKAMAKRPSERYQSMLELDGALAVFDRAIDTSSSHERPLPARPSSPSLSGQRQEDQRGPAPERARASLLLLSLFATACGFAALADVSTSVVRWTRGASITSTEIILASLGSAGLLIAPGFAWGRHLVERVWTSTPRVLDTMARAKRVLVASLVTYAVGMLVVRLFEGALHTDPTGVTWPGWVISISLAALIAGVVAALYRRPLR